jgi:hypothetical protein
MLSGFSLRFIDKLLNQRYKQSALLFIFFLALLAVLRLQSVNSRSGVSRFIVKNLTVEEIYRNKYGRDAPPSYNKWVEYAKSKSCSVDLDDYERINLDLAPFRKTLITKKMIKRGLTLSRMVSFKIENGRLAMPNQNVW